MSEVAVRLSVVLTQAREQQELIRGEADSARFLYATLDPEDAIRIMDDCLASIQKAADALGEVLGLITERDAKIHEHADRISRDHSWACECTVSEDAGAILALVPPPNTNTEAPHAS